MNIVPLESYNPIKGLFEVCQIDSGSDRLLTDDCIMRIITKLSIILYTRIYQSDRSTITFMESNIKLKLEYSIVHSVKLGGSYGFEDMIKLEFYKNEVSFFIDKCKSVELINVILHDYKLIISTKSPSLTNNITSNEQIIHFLSDPNKYISELINDKSVVTSIELSLDYIDYYHYIIGTEYYLTLIFNDQVGFIIRVYTVDGLFYMSGLITKVESALKEIEDIINKLDHI